MMESTLVSMNWVEELGCNTAKFPRHMHGIKSKHVN